MYTLFVSTNAGVMYQSERTADMLEELENRCNELDEQGLRWFVEDEGGYLILEHVCKIHSDIIKMLTKRSYFDEPSS